MIRTFAPKDDRYMPHGKKDDPRYGPIFMEDRMEPSEAILNNIFYIIGAAVLIGYLLLHLKETGSGGKEVKIVFTVAMLGSVILLLSCLKDMISGLLSNVRFYQDRMVIRKLLHTTEILYGSIEEVSGRHFDDVRYTAGTNGRRQTRSKNAVKVWSVIIRTEDGRKTELSEKQFPMIGRKMEYLFQNLYEEEDSNGIF